MAATTTQRATVLQREDGPGWTLAIVELSWTHSIYGTRETEVVTVALLPGDRALITTGPDLFPLNAANPVHFRILEALAR